MDATSRAFTALADPTRRALIARLIEGEAQFTELASPFAMSKPAVVKHLRALEAAGLVERLGTKARPVYRFLPQGLVAPLDWIEQHRRLWEENLDGFAAYAKSLTEQRGGNA